MFVIWQIFQCRKSKVILVLRCKEERICHKSTALATVWVYNYFTKGLPSQYTTNFCRISWFSPVGVMKKKMVCKFLCLHPLGICTLNIFCTPQHSLLILISTKFSFCKTATEYLIKIENLFNRTVAKQPREDLEWRAEGYMVTECSASANSESIKRVFHELIRKVNVC